MQKLLAFLVAAGAASSGARAEFIFGTPLTIAQNATQVTATFVTAKADWTGILFLGSSQTTGAMGTILFNNHAARAGDTRLLGTFNSGDQLFFNYRVMTGLRNDWRMSKPSDALQFALDYVTDTRVVVRIEDMPMSISDRDYDDCVVVLSFSKPLGGGTTTTENTLPTPGAIAVMASAGLLAGRRRR